MKMNYGESHPRQNIKTPTTHNKRTQFPLTHSRSRGPYITTHPLNTNPYRKQLFVTWAPSAWRRCSRRRTCSSRCPAAAPVLWGGGPRWWPARQCRTAAPGPPVASIPVAGASPRAARTSGPPGARSQLDGSSRDSLRIVFSGLEQKRKIRFGMLHFIGAFVKMSHFIDVTLCFLNDLWKTNTR